MPNCRMMNEWMNEWNKNSHYYINLYNKTVAHGTQCRVLYEDWSIAPLSSSIHRHGTTHGVEWNCSWREHWKPQNCIIGNNPGMVGSFSMMSVASTSPTYMRALLYAHSDRCACPTFFFRSLRDTKGEACMWILRLYTHSYIVPGPTPTLTGGRRRCMNVQYDSGFHTFCGRTFWSGWSNREKTFVEAYFFHAWLLRTLISHKYHPGTDVVTTRFVSYDVYSVYNSSSCCLSWARTRMWLTAMGATMVLSLMCTARVNEALNIK